MIDPQDHAAVRLLQLTLKAAGFDPGPADGLYGVNTRAAEIRWQQNQLRGYELDPRSLGNLQRLLPPAQVMGRQHLMLLAAAGIQAKIISGLRTYAEQDALYRQRPKVTNARAGYSNHNFGLAYDVGIFVDGKYLEESPLYAHAGEIGKSIGLLWGGDWKTFPDEPHFELRPVWAHDLTSSQALAAYRTRVARGEPLV